MRIVQLAGLKVGLRRFLAEKTSAAVELVWDVDENHLDIKSGRRGMDITFPPDAMNEEGDPLTDEEKQDIVDKLQVIVDEHNNNITEE